MKVDVSNWKEDCTVLRLLEELKFIQDIVEGEKLMSSGNIEFKGEVITDPSFNLKNKKGELSIPGHRRIIIL